MVELEKRTLCIWTSLEWNKKIEVQTMTLHTKLSIKKDNFLKLKQHLILKIKHTNNLNQHKRKAKKKS